MGAKQFKKKNKSYPPLPTAEQFFRIRVCPNCKEKLVKEGHFVPPCLGDEGFFICKKAGPI